MITFSLAQLVEKVESAPWDLLLGQLLTQLPLPVGLVVVADLDGTKDRSAAMRGDCKGIHSRPRRPLREQAPLVDVKSRQLAILKTMPSTAEVDR